MVRWNQSIKNECIGPGPLLSPNDAKRLLAQSVAVYNSAFTVCLATLH
jgi:hypothetical protein